MIKKQNGFVATEAIIAVLIISLFTGIITTIIYNIYLSNSSIKRMSIANIYITKIMEQIEIMNYDDVNISGLANHFGNNTLYPVNEIEITSNDTSQDTITINNAENMPYKININIESYNLIEGNTDKLDIIKKITVTVSYKLGNRDQSITVSTLKEKEIVEIDEETIQNNEDAI